MGEVFAEAAGRVPVVAGVSSTDVAITMRLAKLAAGRVLQRSWWLPRRTLKTTVEQIGYFQSIAAAVPGTPIMLQNVPPAGAGARCRRYCWRSSPPSQPSSTSRKRPCLAGSG